MATELEIVCVGNELLIGKVVNTNASWMGKRATSLGVDVKRITTVADNVPEMARVFQEVLARKPAFVVITGGLGPTFDDKTLEGLAFALNRKLAVNQIALDMVLAKYREYIKNRAIPESELTHAQVKMATLPEGTYPLTNPVGTAPGVRADIDGTVLMILPGVPREMEAIFEASIVALLRQAAGNVGFFELSLFVASIMESILAPLIDTVMHDHPRVYIKSHPKGHENIELHLSTSASPSEKPQEQLCNAAQQLARLITAAGGRIIKTDPAGLV
jgi:molybdenum cofactor synthesis domain-containing protein